MKDSSALTRKARSGSNQTHVCSNLSTGSFGSIRNRHRTKSWVGLVIRNRKCQKHLNCRTTMLWIINGKVSRTSGTLGKRTTSWLWLRMSNRLIKWYRKLGKSTFRILRSNRKRRKNKLHWIWRFSLMRSCSKSLIKVGINLCWRRVWRDLSEDHKKTYSIQLIRRPTSH